MFCSRNCAVTTISPLVSGASAAGASAAVSACARAGLATAPARTLAALRKSAGRTVLARLGVILSAPKVTIVRVGEPPTRKFDGESRIDCNGCYDRPVQQGRTGFLRDQRQFRRGAQAGDVPRRRFAEMAAVFAAELRGALVADAEGRRGGVQAVDQHQAARVLQA